MIMANKRFIVKLSSEERKFLDAKISKGRTSTKIILKARILLKADQSEAGAGWTDEKICKASYSGCAGVLLPSWRNDFKSSRVRGNPNR
jgi:hypothetical protein